MGGRGPPRLAESWAKRSNGSLFGPGAAQGLAWKPRAHRPQDVHRDTIRGTRGPQETGSPWRPGCSVCTPGGSDTQLKETSHGRGPRVHRTRPATLHPREGQAILTVCVKPEVNLTLRPITSALMSCQRVCGAKVSLEASRCRGQRTRPGASNGHGHTCVCLQSRRH